VTCLPCAAGGHAVLDVAVVVAPGAGGSEVVLLEPFATHRNGEDVVHLLCRLCAAFAFDLALVVVAL